MQMQNLAVPNRDINELLVLASLDFIDELFRKMLCYFRFREGTLGAIDKLRPEVFGDTVDFSGHDLFASSSEM